LTFCPRKKLQNLELKKEKLEKYLGGIKEMKELPGALFVVDPRKERIAVLEAEGLAYLWSQLLIPTVTRMKWIM